MDNPKRPAPGWGGRIVEARAVMKAKQGRAMTQAELGRAAGVTGSMIGFYESETNVPEPHRWELMADALQVRLRWLVFNEGERDLTVPMRAKRMPRGGERAG